MTRPVDVIDGYAERLDRSLAAEEADRVELADVAATLWRRKWLILAGAVAGTVLALLFTSQITPRYTAHANIMLEPRTMQVLRSDDLVSDLKLSAPVVETEVAVLRSNVLLERVVRSLDPADLDRIDPALVPKSRLAGWIGSARERLSRMLAPPEEARGEEGEAFPPEELRVRRLVGEVLGSMTVWQNGDSYVISIVIETVDPEVSALLANRIAQEYISSQIRERADLARTAVSWLTARLEKMRDEVKASEQAVETFRSEQLVASGGMSIETISQQLLQLNTQLVLARADTAMAEARSLQIEKIMAGSWVAQAAELVDSPLTTALREKLSDLNRQDAALAMQFEAGHPLRERVGREIALVKKDLVEEVRKVIAGFRNEAAVARTREESIRSSLGQLEQSYARALESSLGLRQLEREAEALRGAYGALLTRLSETRSLEQLQRADSRIVDRATTPGRPSAPRTSLFAALGGASGFSLALVLGFLLDMGGRGFARVVDIERQTGLPVLAALPRLRARSSARLVRSLRDGSYQPFLEQVRQIRALLAIPRGGVPIRTILVTSSVPGEAKTSTALALALAEALARKRVLLLDLDSRHSSLAHEFRLAPGEDLADFIRSGTATAMRRIDDMGFDMLTVLKPAPGLVDEMEQGHVAELLSALKDRYDVIVIDAPPVLAAAETLVVSQVVDATLFLIRNRTTARKAVRTALARLREMRGAPIAVVLTMTDRNGEFDHGFQSLPKRLA